MKTLIKGSKAELEALKSNYKAKMTDAQVASCSSAFDLAHVQNQLAALEGAEANASATAAIATAKGPLSDLLDDRYGKAMDPELVKKLCAELSTKYVAF
jgi:hypothetical protein